MNDLNTLTMNVWRDKYKLSDEKTPQDTMRRVRKNIAGQLKKNLPNNKKKLEADIQSKLSERGRQIWHNIFNDGIEYLVDKTIDWDKVLPAGSALFGIGNLKANSSISNCFVIDSPHDSLEGISYRINEMRILEKARGGVGTNLSTLRPKGSLVHNQSRTSTGVCTFVVDFSQNNNIVAQDGRRGALMLCLDINHPDVCDFIELKSDLTQVTGANLSVVVDDEFMTNVLCDKPHVMTFPVDSKWKPSLPAIKNAKPGELNYNKGTGTYWKVDSAKRIWDLIIHYAWQCAEPGILFKGNWYKNGTDGVYEQYRPVATNPCSEIAMQPYDSCRLTSYNLVDSVIDPFTEKSNIDFDRLYTMCYMQMILLDSMIDIEIEHINNIINKVKNDKTTPGHIKTPILALYKKILKNTQEGRRCGCGFMGLGDLMAMLNIKFEDIKDKESHAYQMINRIFQVKRNAELDASIDLAVIYGPFKGFNAAKDIKQNFFERMKYSGNNDYAIVERMAKYGRRNVSFSTAAPTGTISMMAGVTSGIEPLFWPFYKRRVKVDASAQEYDYEDKVGCKYKEYMVVHEGLVKFYAVRNNVNFKVAYGILTSMDENELMKIFESSPYYKQCANDIDHESRIMLQTIVQMYTTHSISSTLNLPNSATEEQISNIYMKSWRNGLKGNTVYRDGCREGVLITSSPKDTSKPKERPDSIDGVLHRLKYKNLYYGIVIGLIENKPYEIFILNRVNNILKDIDQDILHGTIVRNGDKDFDFIENEDESGDPFVILNLDEMEDKEQKFQSLTLSRLMRLGESMDKICEIIDKSEPISGTFTSRIQKILSEYKETKNETCPKCGAEMTHENGCVICKNCGYSKC